MAEDTENTQAFSKAIALKSEGEAQNTRITAKGQGELAEMILSIAFENGINVRQDAVLTEILDKLEVDTPIPPEALHTVTEILRYVYMADSQNNMSGKNLPNKGKVSQNNNNEEGD